MKKPHRYAVALAGCLTVWLSSAHAQEWVTEDGFFEGAAFRKVYTFIYERTAMIFTFSQERSECANALGVRFPVEPANGDRFQEGLFCSFLVDDGVSVTPHGYQCFSYIQSGSDFVQVLTDTETPDAALADFLHAAAGARRIGFQAMGSDPFWYDTDGLGSQLEKGFAFCQ